MIQRLHTLAGGEFGRAGHGHGFFDWLCAGALLVGVVSLGGCVVPSAPVTESTKIEVIQLATTNGVMAGSHETVTVTLDPVYQTRKRYRGIRFSQFLKSTGHEPALIPTNTVVQFLCQDGYNPIASIPSLLQDDAFLATGDLDAPSDRTWIQLKAGASQSDPGQFYLVWPREAGPSNSHPWPYGIVALRMGSAKALLGAAQPKSARLQSGFNLFRENCMMCHSLNGVGGTVGVDLNLPLNVFEYWQAGKLPAMVANPAAFRRNAKMPSFDQLGPQAISEILAYVSYMKAHKAQLAP